MAETLNMKEVPISDILHFVEELFDMEIYDPVIALGKMGMGKTAGFKELAKKLGIGYCELRLVNMTETDMLGIPTISADGTTTYASNDLLPIVERDGEKGILVLDEITSCSSTMRAAAYQLLDGQRALGNYKLPDKWIVVGLGNGPDDGGVFNGAEAALFTRCYGFRVATSLEAWKSWAIEHKLNPSVIAFLSYKPDMLHVYDPDSLDGLCPTPRTWEKLSKLLTAKERANNGTLDMNVADFLAAASIGVKAAGEFSGFYQYKASNKMVSVTDILEGKSKGNEIGDIEPQVIYIVIESLIQELNNIISQANNRPDDAVWTKIANAMGWLVDAGSVKLDYGVMGVRDVVAGVDGLGMLMLDDRFDMMCPRFLKFAVDNNIALR